MSGNCRSWEASRGPGGRLGMMGVGDPRRCPWPMSLFPLYHPAFWRVGVAPDCKKTLTSWLDHLVAHLSVAGHLGQLESQRFATGLPWRHSSTGHVWLLGTSMPAQKCWRPSSVGLLRVFGGTKTSHPARGIRGSSDKQRPKHSPTLAL